MNIATRKCVFQYDSDGRIIFDGQYKRVFNNKGQLIEVEEYHESNSSLGDKYEFLYNSENRRVSEQFTQVVSSSWDPKTNIVSDVKTQTTRKYFYYNERGLLEQEKELNKDDKLISLMNYEYEFHE